MTGIRRGQPGKRLRDYSFLGGVFPAGVKMEGGSLDVNMVKGFGDQGGGRMELRARVFPPIKLPGDPLVPADHHEQSTASALVSGGHQAGKNPEILGPLGSNLRFAPAPYHTKRPIP